MMGPVLTAEKEVEQRILVRQQNQLNANFRSRSQSDNRQTVKERRTQDDDPTDRWLPPSS